MSALITDVLDGAVTPGVCNAAVNAGGKLLKVVDMQQRYGTVTPNGRELVLSCPQPPRQIPDDPQAARIQELEAELASLKSQPHANGKLTQKAG